MAMSWESTDIVVVGCGAAGLRAAIAAASHGARCLLIARSKGATRLATADYTLCGTALHALGYRGSEETAADVAQQIVHSSFYLATPAKAMAVAEHAAAELTRLLSWGLPGPAQVGPSDLLIPGRSISAVLFSRCAHLGIPILYGWTVLGLLTANGQVCGIIARDRQRNVRRVRARAVILATGGFHGILGQTTGNVRHRGLGQAWALRAGALLTDMEMINYCPYVVCEGKNKGSILPYLVSHVADAVLVDERGGEIARLHGLTSAGEWDKLLGWLLLAHHGAGASSGRPRLVRFKVTRADHVRLGSLLALFPHGRINDRKQGKLLEALLRGSAVKVGFAPHFSCGGIATDAHGATRVPGLYACGECAGGTFGAFRTFSSVTHCLVSGAIAGASAPASRTPYPVPGPCDPATPDWSAELAARSATEMAARSLLALRSHESICAALGGIRTLRAGCTGGGMSPCHSAVVDRLLVTEACLLAASARADSRGYHVLKEAPVVDFGRNANTSVELDGNDLRVELVRNQAAPPGVARCDYHTFVEAYSRGAGRPPTLLQTGVPT